MIDLNTEPTPIMDSEVPNVPYLLLAEDDTDLRALLSHALASIGLQIVECRHGMELLQKLSHVISGNRDPHLRAIITDIRMPGITGMSVLEGLHELNSHIPIFLVTAFGSQQLHQKAGSLGAIRVFNKPFDVEDLVSSVAQEISK